MKDRRGSINIDVSLLRNFIETHYNVFARDVITINGISHQLVFSLSMGGNFIVSLGSDMLYSGKDISEAIKTFNLDIRGIRELWTNITPDSRNLVSHPRDKIERV
jgi:hypothetical protein